MSELVPVNGKRWGLIAAVLAAVPRQAKVTAGRIRDWVRRGLLEARHVAGRGKGLLVVALEDVLAVERSTRQTVARRGGAKRKACTTVA